MWIWSLLFFALTVLCGFLGLPLIRRLHLGQQVRDDGPKTHFKKSGTPTFGGFFFLIPFAIFLIFQALTQKLDAQFTAVVLLMFCFAAVGFADDYVKVRVDRHGLSVRQKTICLGLASLLFSIWYLWISPAAPILILPFSGRIEVISNGWKYLYLLIMILYLFFIANSVNIADGVDGLCASLSFFCCLSLYFVLCLLEKKHGILPMPGLQLASLCMAAGTAGFFVFNHHPAKIFMGDTGSQSLGAGIAAIALIAGVPWILLFLALVFIVEGLSTLIQVAYFKMSGGKRIFRMAPLHHHFELGGWSEWKIVTIFSICGILAAMIGLLFI